MDYYKVRDIGNRTWQIEDPFDTYCYLVEGSKWAVLIDTCNGLPGLRELVTSLTDRPVVVLLTHGHADHTAAAYEFEQTLIAEQDVEVMKDGLQPARRVDALPHYEELFNVTLPQEAADYYLAVKAPTNMAFIQDGEVIDIGGRHLEIIATPAHTKGSVCVLDRENRMLFSGDTVCDNEILVYFPHSTTVEDVRRSNERLVARAAEYDDIWPGHHRCPLTVQICKDYIHAAEDILQDEHIGKRVELASGYKLLHEYRTIGISYLPGHIYG